MGVKIFSLPPSRSPSAAFSKKDDTRDDPLGATPSSSSVHTMLRVNRRPTHDVRNDVMPMLKDPNQHPALAVSAPQFLLCHSFLVVDADFGPGRDMLWAQGRSFLSLQRH